MERDQVRCFKDEVVNNYTLEMRLDVLDDKVSEYYNSKLQKGVDGIKMQVSDSSGNNLYKGIVWPNEQYEYDAEKGGEYKVCISMTDSMFIDGFSQIKTQVKFASEFHRDKKA